MLNEEKKNGGVYIYYCWIVN